MVLVVWAWLRSSRVMLGSFVIQAPSLAVCRNATVYILSQGPSMRGNTQETLRYLCSFGAVL